MSRWLDCPRPDVPGGSPCADASLRPPSSTPAPTAQLIQAITAGIQQAAGEVIVLMDSDLENDPADIPLLLAKLDEGYDVVSGWRRDRWKGQFLTRQLPSLLANKLIDGIVKEPPGGAHADIDEACRLVKSEVTKQLEKLLKVSPEKLVERRIAKFCDMGVVLKAKGQKQAKA